MSSLSRNIIANKLQKNIRLSGALTSIDYNINNSKSTFVMISYCFATCRRLSAIQTSKYTEYQHYHKDN